ncbi:periplasmic component of amino acid ABC-type transporter/signal transduction system [Idiomarina sp. A28L]|uniref:substrate-binding periplasmic protein n=1 Tax=Idiomarina sp. A28L TaxID=1036674 RepID=UPI0002138CD3|nr:transporter substrate-binding domain-containing protein [Idiomarina sp. A28L]EGN74635.1 periplasmic component of amino acid ABC-type transporter/signal transduction system [Idiomarina sp. A28L]
MNWLTRMLLVVAVAMLVGCTPANENQPERITEEHHQSATHDGDHHDDDHAMMREVDPPCRLVLGFESWEPYQYTSVSGEVGGVDIEIAKRAAAHINCVLEARQGTWRELLEWMQDGDIDFIMGASITSAREDYAWFSIPYRNEQFSLFIRSEEAPRYLMDDIEGFLAAGHKVGVVNEYFYGEELQMLMYDSEFTDQFVGARLNELNLARLLDGDIDGFLEDNLVAASIIRRRSLEDSIHRHHIGLPASEVYVMFSKSAVTEEEVLAFNAALRELMSNGYINDLIRRYGG